MTRAPYDAVVVGLGGMGSAALARSAERGLRVLGLERFGRGHDLGASSGKSRIIRQAYFEDSAYVPLLLRAYDLWYDVSTRTQLEVMNLMGVLLVGSEGGQVVRGSLESARLHGLAVEHLTAAEIVQRFPMMRPRQDEVGVFERDGGAVFPEVAIDAHLRLAEAAGADTRFGVAVDGIAERGETLAVVLADGEEIETRRIALCQGPWLQPLFAQIGVPLVIQRNVQYWFKPGRPDFVPERMPGFLVSRPGLPGPLYGFPDFGGGVKAAFHSHGVATDPENLERAISDDDLVPLQNALEAWMPGAGHEPLHGKACMYSNTPDEHFVIGLHPSDSRIAIAGGFSGHGFKFASVVGEIVSDLLAEGGTRHDIAFLSPLRFGAGV